MSKQDIKAMFDNAVHVGHRTHKWNPRMKKYLYGEKNGVHIINLEKTAEKLDEALGFLNRLSAQGRKVLLVSTKPQSMKLLEDVAGTAGMPYVTSRWIPGLLTNFKTIKTRIKYLQQLQDQEETGEFQKYTKKEAAKLRKTIAKLSLALGGVQGMTDLPDPVFVLDVLRDEIAVDEAKKIGLPVVAFVDSNADPSKINYSIPANDDALKSLVYLLGKVGDALGKSSKSAK